MKKVKLIVCMLFTAFLSFGQSNISALIPYPNQISRTTNEKNFILSENTKLHTNLPAESFCLQEVRQIIQKRTGISILINNNDPSTSKSRVVLTLDPSISGKEHYRLSVSHDRLEINGATPEAIYYGLKTLDQILLGDICRTNRKEIAPVQIDDEPRYGYRALMLDPARHFIPVPDVKFFIDQMAKYKYNTLQLHLTDDQGWRVEIKSHPDLTRVGAFPNPKTGPNGPDNGFYTQEQLKELIRYAKDRSIQIIPEIDIPGHTVAVLAAYPELGCTHTDTLPKIMGETVNLMLCANNDKVYEVYDDIIREIASVFPASSIHLGGDEAVIAKNWTKCDRCQTLMKELGYTQESQLMNYFFKKIWTSVRKYGKEPMLWCELDNIRMPAHNYLFDYPKNVTLITWRAGLTPTCIELTARHGNPLIMAPGEYTYLDYPQLKGDLPEFNNWGMPVTTLETTYQFDPGYGLPEAAQAHIIGVTGTLWGEAIKDINRVTYMAFPRSLALAEAGWTHMEYRNWESFKERIYPNLTDLMKQGVSIRIPFEIVNR